MEKSKAESQQHRPRKRQRRKDSLLHFATAPSKATLALRLWDNALAAIMAEANPLRSTESLTGTKKDNSGDQGACAESAALCETEQQELPVPTCEGFYGVCATLTCSTHAETDAQINSM